jgi:hypothetical protein
LPLDGVPLKEVSAAVSTDLWVREHGAHVVDRAGSDARTIKDGLPVRGALLQQHILPHNGSGKGLHIVASHMSAR